MSPARTSRSMPSTARTCPKRLVRPRVAITVVMKSLSAQQFGGGMGQRVEGDGADDDRLGSARSGDQQDPERAGGESGAQVVGDGVRVDGGGVAQIARNSAGQRDDGENGDPGVVDPD